MTAEAPIFPAAIFLMKVKADTAPMALLVDGVRQLRSLMAPVVESNRVLLSTMVPILKSVDTLYDSDLVREVIRLGLLLESLGGDLDRGISTLDAEDSEAVISLACEAQTWAHIAIDLRGKTDLMMKMVRQQAA